MKICLAHFWQERLIPLNYCLCVKAETRIEVVFKPRWSLQNLQAGYPELFPPSHTFVGVQNDIAAKLHSTLNEIQSCGSFRSTHCINLRFFCVIKLNNFVTDPSHWIHVNHFKGLLGINKWCDYMWIFLCVLSYIVLVLLICPFCKLCSSCI